MKRLPNLMASLIDIYPQINRLNEADPGIVGNHREIHAVIPGFVGFKPDKADNPVFPLLELVHQALDFRRRRPLRVVVGPVGEDDNNHLRRYT